ncbi:MAG TPA: hypothetical protein PK639_02400 [Candidatus Woesebacteria bacterium]|nr:hypothetical protein [Candidatus Woesebacteria bacterium]
MKRIICFLLFIFILLAQEVRAECSLRYYNYLSSYSSDLNLNGETYPNIVFENDSLLLKSNKATFPFIELNNYANYIGHEIKTCNNDVFDVTFKVNSINPMGSGLGFGYLINNIPYNIFSLWADSPGGLYLIYNNYYKYNYDFCKNLSGKPFYSDYQSFPINITDNEWHSFRIERDCQSYHVYIDKGSADQKKFSFYGAQCIPENLWFGNPLSGGGSEWTSMSFKNIKIMNSLDDCVLPTPTPSMAKKKVVVVPGMGASWNSRAIVYNENVADDQWKMTPFVTNYDKLVAAFEENGYVKGVDLFVWNYDWRKPLSEIVGKLNSYIDLISEGEKVDIVGHSLGGLVARVWSQENENKFNKIISLGSPHKGVVEAYEAYYGAKIVDKLDFSTIGLKILFEIQRQGRKPIEAIQNYAPILKDISPTFDFLKKNNKIVSFNKNNYLNNKNISFSGDLMSIVGNGNKLTEWINLTDRSVFDKVMGIWPEGKPISYQKGKGDGTVLEKSSKFGTEIIEIKSEHGELPDLSINKVLTTLGLGITVSLVTENSVDKMVYFIGSPAKIVLACPDETIESDDFILKDLEDDDSCQLKVVGTGEGKYHLLFGNTKNSDSWIYNEGQINNGDEVAVDGDYFYRQIIKVAEELNLLELKAAAENKDDELILSLIFKYRKQSKENSKTWLMINWWRQICLSKEYENKLTNDVYKKALEARSLVDRISRLKIRFGINPTEYGANSFNELDKYYVEMVANKTKDRSLVMANAKLIIKLAEDVW